MFWKKSADLCNLLPICCWWWINVWWLCLKQSCGRLYFLELFLCVAFPHSHSVLTFFDHQGDTLSYTVAQYLQKKHSSILRGLRNFKDTYLNVSNLQQWQAITGCWMNAWYRSDVSWQHNPPVLSHPVWPVIPSGHLHHHLHYWDKAFDTCMVRVIWCVAVWLNFVKVHSDKPKLWHAVNYRPLESNSVRSYPVKDRQNDWDSHLSLFRFSGDWWRINDQPWPVHDALQLHAHQSEWKE